jgi:hypothetical protein
MPTSYFRFKGIRCNDAYLDVIALGAFEQTVFKLVLVKLAPASCALGNEDSVGAQ